MSLRSLLADVLKPKNTEPAQTDKRNEVKTPFLSSKRFLVLIAFSAALLLNLLPVAQFHDITLVVIAYLVGESAVRAVEVAANAWIKVHEVKTDIDYERLDAETKRTGDSAKAA